MDYKLQLISLIYSFGYGVFFYFFNFLNDKFLGKKKVLDVLILLMFIVLNSIIYLTILYKINFGVFHIYFLIMIVLGYYCGCLFKKYISNNVKCWKKIKFIKKI